MTTKQEYIDVLGQMEELYNNSDNCTLAMNLFKEDINLLTGLVNEHFEEKAETNYEHYKDEIIENCGFTFALVDGKLHKCDCVSCSDCGFSTGHGCSEKIKEWLKKPYKKKTYKLSQFEYDLIQTYRDGNTDCNLSDRRILRELKDKGYFKCVDYDTKIHDVLEACEVIQ
jgi:hypothetical protein